MSAEAIVGLSILVGLAVSAFVWSFRNALDRAAEDIAEAMLELIHEGAAHVVPRDDLIEHDSNADCVCNPECQPVERSDGSIGWLYVHHSLDGRENQEEKHG